MLEVFVYGFLFLCARMAAEYAYSLKWGYLASRTQALRLLRMIIRHPWQCCLLFPVVEEAVFRLLCLGVVLSFYPALLWCAVFLQALLFGLGHTQYALGARLMLVVGAIGTGIIFVAGASVSNLFAAFLLVVVLHVLKNTFVRTTLVLKLKNRSAMRHI